MRWSEPMPRATSCTSTPTASHRSAISLMKVIFTARNALAAYLISSAARRPRDLDRRLIEKQRPVDVAQHVTRVLRLGADDDAVRAFEVFDRRALAQELGVRRDGDVVGFRHAAR